MRLYVYVAIALALLGAGFGAGWNVRAWKADADNSDRIKQEIAQQQANAFKADAASVHYETGRADREALTRVITREVVQVVEKPIYRNVCLDDDGLRAVAHALGAPDTAGEPSSPMPAASSPD